MSTPKTNGNGAKEVTPATANKTQGNGTTPKVPRQLTEEEKAAQERQTKLEAQRKHFDGLYRLTSMRGRYLEHLEALKTLTISDEEMDDFEADDYSGLIITLKNRVGSKYEIKHPYLVKLNCEFLIAHFEQKIAECEHHILTYGS